MDVNKNNHYLSEFSLARYLKLMAKKFPQFYETFWFDRPKTLSVINKMTKMPTDFEGKEKGGRGDSYMEAQRDPLVRIVGINKLLSLAVSSQDLVKLPHTYKILDVLGGDGTIARAYSLLMKERANHLLILTGDIAEDMIINALKYGLPAIRQPAQYLFLKDNSFDAVIIAYGTHHIPESQRLRVFKEAQRVLKPKGKIIIHDFEKNSPIELWFHEVVDKYSTTGHKYSHFSKAKLRIYLKNSGFKNIKIFQMYDPFVISDSNKQNSYNRLMDYVLNMYGLEKLKVNRSLLEVRERISHLIRKYIHYDSFPPDFIKENTYWRKTLSFYQQNGRFVAEMPRIALVAIGQK